MPKYEVQVTAWASCSYSQTVVVEAATKKEATAKAWDATVPGDWEQDYEPEFDGDHQIESVEQVADDTPLTPPWRGDANA